MFKTFKSNMKLLFSIEEREKLEDLAKQIPKNSFSPKEEGHHSDGSGRGPADTWIIRHGHELIHKSVADACRAIGEPTRGFYGDPTTLKPGNKFFEEEDSFKFIPPSMPKFEPQVFTLPHMSKFEPDYTPPIGMQHKSGLKLLGELKKKNIDDFEPTTSLSMSISYLKLEKRYVSFGLSEDSFGYEANQDDFGWKPGDLKKKFSSFGLSEDSFGYEANQDDFGWNHNEAEKKYGTSKLPHFELPEDSFVYKANQEHWSWKHNEAEKPYLINTNPSLKPLFKTSDPYFEGVARGEAIINSIRSKQAADKEYFDATHVGWSTAQNNAMKSALDVAFNPVPIGTLPPHTAGWGS